ARRRGPAPAPGLARPAGPRAGQPPLRARDPGRPGGPALPGLRADGLGLPHRPPGGRGARPDRRHGPVGRGARRPDGPPDAAPVGPARAAPQPGPPGGVDPRRHPARGGAVRPRRAAGRPGLGRRDRPPVHHPEPRPARPAALGRGAELRPLPGHDGRRTRPGRPAHRRRGRRVGVRRERRGLAGHGPRRLAHRRPAAGAGRGPRARRCLDRRGPALRQRQPGAQGLVRHRPHGDDVRDAPGAVSRAGGERVRRRRGGHGPALLLRLGGRPGRRAPDGLGAARPPPGGHRALGGGRVGPGDRRRRAHHEPLGGGGLLLRRGRRGQRERGLPLDDQPHGHARPPARAHVLRLPARRHGRAAPGRRRGRRGGRPGRAALLRDVRRPGLPGRRGARRGRVPGARPLRRRRVAPRGARPRARRRL
ncbi:MAG: hypothetical protein AVDCRST_MAG13-2020, partial [uncultured Solirubrobacteraceae bacterium]